MSTEAPALPLSVEIVPITALLFLDVAHVRRTRERRARGESTSALGAALSRNL
jgi:hypothetical protein